MPSQVSHVLVQGAEEMSGVPEGGMPHTDMSLWPSPTPVRATLECCRDYTIMQADRGENQSMNNQHKYNKGGSHLTGENQNENSKVSPLPVSPYYTTPDCTQGHYSVYTDPALCGPLTDSGCTYVSYFTSMVTLEVKVEWSSYLRAEWSSDIGVEWSSDLEVEWNLEQC